MNTKIRSFAFSLTACLLVCCQSWAQRGPQDTWYETRQVALPNNCDPYDIIVLPGGNLLLTDVYRDKLLELSPTGSIVKWYGSRGTGNGQFQEPAELAIGPNNRIYVSDRNNHRIQILERNGTFVKSFGESGTGDGQFNQPWGLAISNQDEVFVVDSLNKRIQVFDDNGTFLRKWGSSGNLEGQFAKPFSAALTPKNELMVVDYDNNRLVFFDTFGKQLKKFSLYRQYNFRIGSSYVSYLNNGLLFVGGGNDGGADGANYVNIYDQEGEIFKRWKFPSTGFTIGTMLEDGQFVIADRVSKKLFFYRQTYRTLRSNSSKDAPLPEVISVAQPAGTNHLEIKYRITDADSAKVKAGLLAFKDGGNDLTKVIVPKTFIGSIAGKLDENTTTGTIHTVTWDAKADWGVTYGDIEVAVIAQDDRDLMNFHFLTLPATGGDSTELKISRSPVNNPDFLNAWYTLLSFGDEGIEFTSDFKIKGQSGIPQIDGGFSPSDLSGLTMWLDAKDIDGDGNADSLANDSNISVWCDKTGGDHNATANSNFPLYKTTGFNNMPSVKFNKLNGWLSFPEISTIRSVYWVYKGAAGHLLGHSTNYHFHQNGNTSLWSPQWASGSVRGGRAYLLGNQVSPTTEPFPSNTPIILSIVTTGNTKANLIGKERNAGGHSGYLSELLIFTRALDESEQAKVDRYLANKWGISESLVFASGSTTTSSGRAYLFDKMNLRQATTAEITRAKEAATPGVTNKFEPGFKVGPGERPVKVNEYGFDTGATSGYWVVPKN
jgi:hypothetical protein